MNTKQISLIKKTFAYDNEESENIKPENFKGLMDASNCLMLVPKTTKSDKALSGIGYMIFDKITTLRKADYKFSRYSKEFLINILKVLVACDESETIDIGVGEDMPLIMENNHIAFILAPRVDNEEKGIKSEIYKTMSE